jgi:hypothetical protein
MTQNEIDGYIITQAVEMATQHDLSTHDKEHLIFAGRSRSRKIDPKSSEAYIQLLITESLQHTLRRIQLNREIANGRQ